MQFASSLPVIRRFCGACGTLLTYEYADAPGKIEITTVSLDEPSEVLPTREIWLAERVTWVAVSGSLKHYWECSSGPLIDVS
jgi:hypothetical protein